MPQSDTSQAHESRGPRGTSDDVGGRTLAVHHVNLIIAVGGIDRALDFYTRLLGFDVVTKAGSSPGGRWLRAGSVEIHLSEREGSSHPDAHVALVVDNLAAIRRLAGELGSPWHDAEPFVGVDRAFVVDPDGNLVELIQLG